MTLSEIQNRLNEIAAISLQDLEDDAVLALLQERKKLLAEEARVQQALEEEKKEEERRQQELQQAEALAKAKELEAKKASLLSRLEEVNRGITPDQDDDKLLALIQERKELEAELNVYTATEPGPISEPLPVSPVNEELEAAEVEEEAAEASVPEEIVPSSGEKIAIKDIPYTKTSHISQGGRASGVDADTDERIAVDSSLQSSEYQGYLSELKANLNSLGTFLQGLPIAAKRNRAFMLEVARIDPAYAMHYADKDTLKKDESFNVTIAGMNNQRNTGNPLSEMLPEMRTGAVLMAGVKNDFRNVRFVRPEMPEYKEIIALAQKGALEAVKSLRSAHDIQFLLPPILQKDRAFMAEVAKLTK